MLRSMRDTVSRPVVVYRCSGYGTDMPPVTTGKIMSLEELGNVQGRPWEDVDVSFTATLTHSYM